LQLHALPAIGMRPLPTRQATVRLDPTSLPEFLP
jgi:hypothetical protein